jgi:hypothetical protein
VFTLFEKDVTTICHSLFVKSSLLGTAKRLSTVFSLHRRTIVNFKFPIDCRVLVSFSLRIVSRFRLSLPVNSRSLKVMQVLNARD